MSDSEDIDEQIMKLKNEIKAMNGEDVQSEEEIIEIVEKPKKNDKVDGRKKPRSEAQKANLAKMREAKLLKAAERKRAAELKKLKEQEIAEEIERKKLKTEYKKKYKKRYASSSSSSSSSEVKYKKKKKSKKDRKKSEKKKKKAKSSSSSSGSMSPIFKIDQDTVQKPEKVKKITTKDEEFELPGWAME